ncbi:hypothetical protein Fcan01_14374 [Folsomia candida]|uniref:Uncharacterized protein n=1 Tax=Folsomia candida TaxID=158441 RepID=A0A226E313_FOLCA|nr:hypothetical protein Fcan01_14374 [Folsomia candida]
MKLLVLALFALAQGRPENGDKIDYRLLGAAKQAENGDKIDYRLLGAAKQAENGDKIDYRLLGEAKQAENGDKIDYRLLGAAKQAENGDKIDYRLLGEAKQAENGDKIDYRLLGAAKQAENGDKIDYRLLGAAKQAENGDKIDYRLLGAAKQAENGDKIDYRLLGAAKQAETADIFITFQESTAQTLQAIESTRFDTREDRLNAMNSALVRLAGRVQSNVLSYLQGRFEFKSFWITNQVYVKGATLDLIMVLASFNEVKSLKLEEIIELDTIGGAGGISCRGCATSSCARNALLACAQLNN